jgi:hypothetical protein
LKLAAGVAHTVDVDGMLDSISPRQFDEWRAYDAYISPIGQDRLDVTIAEVATCLCQLLGKWVGVDPEIIEPDRFVPWIESLIGSPPDQSEEEMKSRMGMAIAQSRAAR